MLFNMSTYEPDAESFAADSEDYAIHLLRSRYGSPATQLATHGYRDVDAGTPADLAGLDVDSLLDDAEGHRF